MLQSRVHPFISSIYSIFGSFVIISFAHLVVLFPFLIHILYAVVARTWTVHFILATCMLNSSFLFKGTLAGFRCRLEFFKLHQERRYRSECRDGGDKCEDTDQCPVVDLEHCT